MFDGDGEHAMGCRRYGVATLRHDAVKFAWWKCLGGVMEAEQSHVEDAGGIELRPDVEGNEVFGTGQTAVFDVSIRGLGGSNAPSIRGMWRDRHIGTRQREIKVDDCR